MAANEQKVETLTPDAGAGASASDSADSSASGLDKTEIIVAAENHHPLFSSPKADIVLRSTDGVLYRVYSYTLRITTGLFRTMFSLPQPRNSGIVPESGTGAGTGMEGGRGCGREDRNTKDSGADDDSTLGESIGGGSTTTIEPIPVHESSEILTLFLILLSGRPTKPMSSWGDYLHAPISESAVVAGIGEESSQSGSGSGTSSSIRSMYDVIERVLTLAENWDAPGPISYIRTGITDPELLNQDPLRLYAIASHFGWESERVLAARYTLKLDLFGDVTSSVDSQVSNDQNDNRNDDGGEGGDETKSDSTPTTLTLTHLSPKDLLYILKLRRSRREAFRSLINNADRFTAGNSDSYICSRCGVATLDNSSWRSLKEAMMVEMDRRPLGDTIVGVGGAVGVFGFPVPVPILGDFDGCCSSNSYVHSKLGLGVVSWPEAEVCWAAKCVKEDCDGLNYDRYATLRQIQLCIDGLPWI